MRVYWSLFGLHEHTDTYLVIWDVVAFRQNLSDRPILRVSTALTYDRQGRCIEGVGIPVDRPVIPNRFSPDAPDAVLLVADQAW